MAKTKSEKKIYHYIIQIKLSGGESLFGKYSDGNNITALNDSEAINEARRSMADLRSLGQGEGSFRLLKVVHIEEN